MVLNERLKDSSFQSISVKISEAGEQVWEGAAGGDSGSESDPRGAVFEA